MLLYAKLTNFDNGIVLSFTIIVRVLVNAAYVNNTSEEDAIKPLTVLKKLTEYEKVATFYCVSLLELVILEWTVRFSHDISLVL